MNNLQHFSGKKVTLRIIYKEPSSYEDRVVEVTGVLDYKLLQIFTNGRGIMSCDISTERGHSQFRPAWFISGDADYFNPCTAAFNKNLDFATIEHDGLIIATSKKVTTLYDMVQ